MSRIRYQFVLAVLWLFCFYNVERLHEPINIASFTYPFVALVAAVVILVPAVVRLRPGWPLAATAVLFLVLKVWRGYPVVGHAIPLTLSELMAVGVTLMLARAIAMSLWGIEQAVTAVMVEHLQDAAVPFASGQERIYQEIRRARRYGRPFSLLAIGTDGDAEGAELSALFERLQRENVGRYLSAQLAHLVTEQTKDCDIVTRRNGHFVVGLPETAAEEAEQVVREIEQAAAERLGIRLRVGFSTFPEQEVTFERLLARAESSMQVTEGDPAGPDGASGSNGDGPKPGGDRPGGTVRANGR